MPKAKYTPCIKVCTIGEDGYCQGCLRTKDEVAGWRNLTEDEQLAGIQMLKERRIKLKLIQDLGVGEPHA